MVYKVGIIHGANPKQIHAQNRAHTGVELYKSGRVSKVITTGKNEADDLAQRVYRGGVPERDIRTENRSKTTYQNLDYTRELLDFLSRDFGSLELAYLISQEWHRPRLLYVARHVLGRRYQHEFYPAPDGRSQEEVDADANLEKLKFVVDRAALLVPVFGGLINSSAYWVLTKVRR